MQRQRPHAPEPWVEHAQRCVRVEDLVPTHVAGKVDMGQVVVLEGTRFGPLCGWNGGSTLDRGHLR